MPTDPSVPDPPDLADASGLDVVAAARGMLGARLETWPTDAGSGAAAVVAVELTEVEAYAGGNDPASHAYRGPTRRTAVMFGPPGRLYVYLSMGLHACANVVLGPDGAAGAVLLRAGRVVDGLGLARERRGTQVADRALARGPGNLCRALGISLADGGAVLDADAPRPAPGSDLMITLHPRTTPATGIEVGPRVGVSRAADVPWRFWIAGEPTVSAYRRSPRADPAPPDPTRPD